MILVRQGIALCGEGDEMDSNSMQLLVLCGKDDPRIETWIQCKTELFHDIQN